MISVSLSVSANKLVDAISKNIEQRAKCFMISSFYLERQGSVATHGCTVYLRSEERPSHSDTLWVVDWNPLFEGFMFFMLLVTSSVESLENIDKERQSRCNVYCEDGEEDD